MLFAYSLYCQDTDSLLIKKALQIHDKIFTIDSHTDTPMHLDGDFDLSKKNDINKGSRVDFPRMKEGGLDAAFFAVFLNQNALTEKGFESSKKEALSVFDSLRKAIKNNYKFAEIALSPEDGYRIEKSGKRAIYIGVENGYPIGEDISNVKLFYDLGARYITLVHTRNNQICASSTDKKGEKDYGLTEFGKQVVYEMNRLGIMVDISHASDKSFYDVLKISKTPVIASHSCARAICDHPRNLSDDMLKALAKNGGVIQMCILSSYVNPDEKNPARDEAYSALTKKYGSFNNLDEETRKQARKEWYELSQKFPMKLANVKDVVNHIDHIVKIAGIDHVGIGSDFDGGGAVNGCLDVSEMKNITIELVKRGYNEEQIRKIWGGNLMRVMSEVINKSDKKGL